MRDQENPDNLLICSELGLWPDTGMNLVFLVLVSNHDLG